MLWVPVLGAILVWTNPPAAVSGEEAEHAARGAHSYQINPKPCWVNGLEGTCMFVWECMNSEGRPLGMCVDTFMFGSCCAHNLTDNQLTRLPSASEPAVLFTEPGTTRPRPYKLRPTTHRPSTTVVPTEHRPHRPTKPLGGTTRPQFMSRPSTGFHATTTDGGTTPAAAVHSTHVQSSQANSSTEKWSHMGSEGLDTNPLDLDSGNNHVDVTWAPHWPNPAFVTRPRPQASLSWAARPRPIPTTLLLNITTSSTTTTTTPTATTTTPPPTTASTTTSTSTTKPPPTTAAPTALPQTTPIIRPVAATSGESAEQCGTRPLLTRPETRIVGGRNAQFGVWPWQVSVRRTSFFGFSSTHRCGGALLNEKWIATAGHCVDDLLTSQIRIRVGEYDFSSLTEPFPYSERGAARKVVHPKYNFFTYEHDLALVLLDSPLQFAPHIAPICLPGSNDLLIGENATVTGWGRLSEGGNLPSVLQEVTVPIVSNDKCKTMFLRAGRHEFIPEIFMCAGFDDGGRDSCQGDSGGPLQVRGKDGRYFLAGIISWGIGCAEANLPGVCTRISKFVPWILETVT